MREFLDVSLGFFGDLHPKDRTQRRDQNAAVVDIYIDDRAVVAFFGGRAKIRIRQAGEAGKKSDE
ncbi:hypothetical protein NSPZN2_100134 [Nitrospira defluvii]|uniref:Uncharacterized protein n=1 Tax=Nitrospira defluvii TaxID=330214 RepID=A0ABM8R0M1_9BACT|nr:hypothetical protein NSPZN2_100134 [Nitrospira defluvii]